MTEQRSYDEATKAAVMAALLTGQSVNSVAKAYQIPEATVRYWRAKSKAFSGVGAQKRDEISEKLYAYLMANLDALKVQSDVFADPKWLREQPANELAVLHGVLTDKAIRLLEARTPDDTEQTDT